MTWRLPGCAHVTRPAEHDDVRRERDRRGYLRGRREAMLRSSENRCMADRCERPRFHVAHQTANAAAYALTCVNASRKDTSVRLAHGQDAKPSLNPALWGKYALPKRKEAITIEHGQHPSIDVDQAFAAKAS